MTDRDTQEPAQPAAGATIGTPADPQAVRKLAERLQGDCVIDTDGDIRIADHGEFLRATAVVVALARAYLAAEQHLVKTNANMEAMERDLYLRLGEEERKCEAAESDRAALQAENARLKGIMPEFPPRPPQGTGLPRYGIRWNGPREPLAVPMDDGYWTPWHLADALRAENADLRMQLAAQDAEKIRVRDEMFDTQISCAERLLAARERADAALAAGQPVPSDLEAK